MGSATFDQVVLVMKAAKSEGLAITTSEIDALIDAQR